MLQMYPSRVVNLGSLQEDGATFVQCVFFWEQLDGPQSYGYGNRFHCVVRLIVKPAENQATVLLSFPYTAQALHGFGSRLENLLPLFHSLYDRLKPYLPIPFAQVGYILHDGYHFSFAVPMDADRYWTLPIRERFQLFCVPELLVTPLKEKQPGQYWPSTPAPCQLIDREVAQQRFQPFTLWPVQSVMASLQLNRLMHSPVPKIPTAGTLDQYWINKPIRNVLGNRMEYVTLFHWKYPDNTEQTYHCLVRLYTPKTRAIVNDSPTVVLISQLDYPAESIAPHWSIIANSIHQIFINIWRCLPESILWYLHQSEVFQWYDSPSEYYEQVLLRWDGAEFQDLGHRQPLTESDVATIIAPFVLTLRPPLFLLPSSQ
jgi:hypothetical protein